MDSPFISIVIITRNRRKYLEECVNSVLMQDHPGFEILIGDNGSADDSLDRENKDLLNYSLTYLNVCRWVPCEYVRK